MAAKIAEKMRRVLCFIRRSIVSYLRYANNIVSCPPLTGGYMYGTQLFVDPEFTIGVCYETTAVFVLVAWVYR